MIKIKKIPTIHPFAARMAPEIAFNALADIRHDSVILDPMVGSGTVLRTVSDLGFQGVGFDLDPLSVLMSKVGTTPLNSKILKEKTDTIISTACELNSNDLHLPWIDSDTETNSFINFWFASTQKDPLRKLSYILHDLKGPYANALRIGLSKLIITKNTGASLAGDVSHGRPHKIRDKNDYDVFSSYKNACYSLAKILDFQSLQGSAIVKLGDARNLNLVKNESIDAVITSPPYLNAIDYMRGHKFALVWLGYRIQELRLIRSNSVGAEKGPDNGSECEKASVITKQLKDYDKLPSRIQKMIIRYILDMYDIIAECSRVLKIGGKATFVVGNSSLQGIYIRNTAIVDTIAYLNGLRLESEIEREIPVNKRYMPAPAYRKVSTFKNRMRTESVMTFFK